MKDVVVLSGRSCILDFTRKGVTEMDDLMKHFWFKRLPVLRMNAAVWDSHIAQHWNLDLIRTQIAMPTKEVRPLLERFMPELLPEFESLLSVSPDRPGHVQLLAMYNLPPFFSGCSNSISHRLGHQTLIRNYDFGIDEFSGVFCYEPLSDGGWIIGSAEGGWQEPYLPKIF